MSSCFPWKGGWISMGSHRRAPHCDRHLHRARCLDAPTGHARNSCRRSRDGPNRRDLRRSSGGLSRAAVGGAHADAPVCGGPRRRVASRWTEAQHRRALPGASSAGWRSSSDARRLRGEARGPRDTPGSRPEVRRGWSRLARHRFRRPLGIARCRGRVRRDRDRDRMRSSNRLSSRIRSGGRSCGCRDRLGWARC